MEIINVCDSLCCWNIQAQVGFSFMALTYLVSVHSQVMQQALLMNLIYSLTIFVFFHYGICLSLHSKSTHIVKRI